MVYTKTYYYFKSLLIQNVTMSVYLLCVSWRSLITIIISDQGDERKILAMED